VPNQPRQGTGVRSFRVNLALWQRAQALAAENGETVGDVIRRALERYVKRV